MKKLTVIMLILAVALGSVFAGGGSEKQQSTVPQTVTVTQVQKAEPEYKTSFATNSVYAGSITTVLGSSEGGEVSYDYFKGVSGKDYTDPAYYTYNDYTAGTSTQHRMSPFPP